MTFDWCYHISFLILITTTSWLTNEQRASEWKQKNDNVRQSCASHLLDEEKKECNYQIESSEKVYGIELNITDE